MASFNQVTLVGNITRDIEVRFLQGGSAVADIGLAVNDRIKKGNEWIDETTFVDITLFGRTAEVAGEYLQKGSPVLISGRLKFEQWEKDGQKRSKLKVIGDKLQMLGGKPAGGNGDSINQSGPTEDEYPQAPRKPEPTPVDDIPF